MERYVLHGGQEGYDRLLVLSQERWPDTSALFTRAGIGRGMNCVDLGCGGGEVTFELAKLAGPKGTAVGIDMDSVKLELGRKAARERGITNVEFKQLNVNDWEVPDSYDVVYSRFLMQHLSQPLDLLRRMWRSVRPGGVIVIEDADHDGWYCHPPNPGFDFFVKTFQQALDGAGGDHAFGRKLYECFCQADIPAPEVRLVQSARTAGEAKSIAWLTLKATEDTILSQGIASPDQVTHALDELWRFTEDPVSLIGAPRVFQLWARR